MEMAETNDENCIEKSYKYGENIGKLKDDL